MEGQYLIPANTKKSQLIFNMFRPLDLGILITGALITLVFLFVFLGDSALALTLKLAPVGICTFIVMPVANYHNVLVFTQEVYEFFMSRRIYIWKGWCVLNEFSEEKDR